MVRRGAAALLCALALLLGTLAGMPSAAVPAALPAGPPALRAQPADDAHGFADPSVVRYDGGYLAVLTGLNVPRAVAEQPTGPWTRTDVALPVLPAWARTAEVWASDLVEIGGQWVLYFSAPVRGLGRRGRCIGVATATDPLGSFVPRPRPLVCPHQADTPRPDDLAGSKGRQRRLPRLGVIDPSAFTDRGAPYLLYKTQGTPSSIRLLPLGADGTAKLRGTRSRELLRTPGIVENPLMVRHRGDLVLFTSEGSYRSCGYRTTWRRSPGLTRWRPGPTRVLADGRRDRICGPGGADAVEDASGRRIVFLHGWTCWADRVACPRGRDLENAADLDARRSLFAAGLVWREGRPALRFLSPPISPPASPPVSPPVS